VTTQDKGGSKYSTMPTSHGRSVPPVYVTFTSIQHVCFILQQWVKGINNPGELSSEAKTKRKRE